MPRMPWPAVTGLIVTLMAAPSRAQDLLTVEDAIQLTLTRNAVLRAADAGVTEADARVAEARAGWLPRVSVAETWQRGDQPVFVFSSLLASRRFGAENFAIDVLNHPDPIGFFRTSLGVEQTLFDGGLRASSESARLQRDIAQHLLEETRFRLVISTTEAYGRGLASEAGRRAAVAALEAAERDRLRAAERRDAGLATDADVLAIEAHIADLEHRRIQHEGDAAIAGADLNRLMGVPVDRAYAVVEPQPPPPHDTAPVDLQALLAEAVANRPELQRAAAATQWAQAERARAGAALLPRVAAQGGVEITGTGIADRASSWIVGVEARWSLSLGGAERARLQAAAAAETRAAAEADDARAAVQADVVSALSRARSASARLAAGSAAIAQASEAERIVRDRVEAGLATVTDLLRASTAVLDAQARRTAAIVDALVSDAQMKRALGRTP